MVAYTDATLITLWYISTRCTEKSGSKSFFVDDEKYLFLFFDIFCNTFLDHLAKISMLTSHIDKIDVFILFWMREEFVIHR